MWIQQRDWHNLSYLESGSPDQRALYRDVQVEGIFDFLVDYSPTLVSTHCIGLNTKSSDIDIICSYPSAVDDRTKLIALLGRHLSKKDNYSGCILNADTCVVLARFSSAGWDYELYADVLPVQRQHAYRHLTIMDNLLRLGGEQLKEDVLHLRYQGQKGEAAFCQCLHLTGDPFQKLLELEILSLAEIQEVLASAGYSNSKK